MLIKNRVIVDSKKLFESSSDEKTLSSHESSRREHRDHVRNFLRTSQSPQRNRANSTRNNFWPTEHTCFSDQSRCDVIDGDVEGGQLGSQVLHHACQAAFRCCIVYLKVRIWPSYTSEHLRQPLIPPPEAAIEDMKIILPHFCTFISSTTPFTSTNEALKFKLRVYSNSSSGISLLLVSSCSDW